MPCNCCDDKVLIKTNFDKLARFLHSQQYNQFKSFYKENFEDGPDELKWEFRNQARGILTFLNIKVDDF
jgi:hypothetical protein